MKGFHDKVQVEGDNETAEHTAACRQKMFSARSLQQCPYGALYLVHREFNRET